MAGKKDKGKKREMSVKRDLERLMDKMEKGNSFLQRTVEYLKEENIGQALEELDGADTILTEDWGKAIEELRSEMEDAQAKIEALQQSLVQ